MIIGKLYHTIEKIQMLFRSLLRLILTTFLLYGGLTANQ